MENIEYEYCTAVASTWGSGVMLVLGYKATTFGESCYSGKTEVLLFVGYPGMEN